MRAEQIQRHIQNCFNSEELAFLVRDGVFKKMLEEAKDANDFDALTRLGSTLLSDRDYPEDPRTRRKLVGG